VSSYDIINNHASSSLTPPSLFVCRSDVAYIAEQLGPALAEKKEAVMAQFVKADTAGAGSISYEKFQEAFAAADMELNDQVLITLLRRFDLNRDGHVAYNELMMIAK